MNRNSTALRRPVLQWMLYVFSQLIKASCNCQSKFVRSCHLRYCQCIKKLSVKEYSYNAQFGAEISTGQLNSDKLVISGRPITRILCGGGGGC